MEDLFKQWLTIRQKSNCGHVNLWQRMSVAFLAAPRFAGLM